MMLAWELPLIVAINATVWFIIVRIVCCLRRPLHNP
jgi:hypothetical protein